MSPATGPRTLRGHCAQPAPPSPAMNDTPHDDAAPNQDIYIAMQPIVYANRELVGYELLFRSAPRDVADHDDSVLATATVIANVFGDMGLEEVIGSVDGYLNVDTDFLFSELVEAKLDPAEAAKDVRTQRLRPPGNDDDVLAAGIEIDTADPELGT